MKSVIICTRDIEYGIGSQVKNEIKKFDRSIKVKKIIVISPKKLSGYSDKVHFEIIPHFGRYFITKEPFFAIKCRKKIDQIIKKEKIDEIYLHFPILCRDFNTKIIAKCHGLHSALIKNSPNSFIFLIARFFHTIYSYFEYKNLKYADKILFVSKRTLEEAKKIYPQFVHKFEYSPNEVDKSKFPKLSEKERIKLKKELGFDDGKKNILYVGRLDPLKGIQDLINAIEEINDPKIKLIVIGEGHLKEKVQKYSFVKYLGKIPNEELYKYYNATDLFVLPSHYENCPMTVLEAKACGGKILATDVGDNKYNLKKNQIYHDKINLKKGIIKFLGLT